MTQPLLTQPATGDLSHVFTPAAFRHGVLDPLFSREGVLELPGNALRVTQRGAGANMSVDVAAGRCVVRGDRVTDQGTYVCTSTATENRTVTAPTSGSRAYRIVARVRDRHADPGDTGSDWLIESSFTAGTTPPAVPASAISLATFVLTSSTTSVTTGMIADTRLSGTVGTKAETGTWGQTGFAPVWRADDGTRPLTWMRTPDGWVTLSGWIMRRNETVAVGKDEFYHWDRTFGWGNTAATPVLPESIRPSGGVRDTITISSNGDLHLVMFPSGAMAYRFQYATTLVADQTWVSFDGVSYRADSF